MMNAMCEIIIVVLTRVGCRQVVGLRLLLALPQRLAVEHCGWLGYASIVVVSVSLVVD